MYLYELPTTGAVSFSDCVVDNSIEGLYTRNISEATQARANLRGLLKESKRTDDNEKDYLRLVKVLDDYLPQLYGIISCITSNEMSTKSQPMFSWRTTLSANLFNSSPRLSLPSLQADLASTLVTYAFALSNLAHSVTASVGSYERERAIKDADRKAKDEKLNFAVTLLSKASGIFSHLSDDVLLELDTEWNKQPALIPTRPMDLNQDVNSALAKMALADAQTLAIRKLLSKSAYDSTITPGPPLPKSHPSPALLAKLHLECASLYTSARALAKTPGSASSITRSKAKLSLSSGIDGDVSAELRHYLADEAALHTALAHKWLGVDAGENGGDAKAGQAVGFLVWAKKELDGIKDSVKIIGSGREKDNRERRKARLVEELEAVNTFLSNYKKINDSLSFQPVPPQSDLQATIPAGRLAVASKPYMPPTPAFGPGSTEYVRRQAEKLELAEDCDAKELSAVSNVTSLQSSGSYSGAGSYF